MKRPAPTIALIASHGDQLSGPLITTTFGALLDRGWDAHLVFDGDEARRLGTLPYLSNPALGPRVHLSGRHKPRGIARADIPRGVARGLLGNPRGAARWMQAGGRPRLSVLAGHDVDAALIALRPQVIHFDSAASAAAHLRVREILGSKAVVTVTREEAGPSSRLPDDVRTVVARADVLHVPDDSVWRRMLANGRPAPPRVTGPSPMLTPGFFEPASPEGRDEDEPRILRVLSVGSLTWVHGLEWTLQAMRLLLDSGAACEYRIAGRGEHLDALCFARHELGLVANVDLRDEPLDADGLKRELRWADAYLDGAVAAGTTGVAAEALAMGVPVVATDRAWLPPGAIDGENVFVVARRKPELLAERLALLASDRELRTRMGAAGRRAMHFRIDNQVAQLERAYRELVAR
jgi:glycosyltransferase involved in cell wall biosynthesis